MKIYEISVANLLSLKSIRLLEFTKTKQIETQFLMNLLNQNPRDKFI